MRPSPGRIAVDLRSRLRLRRRRGALSCAAFAGTLTLSCPLQVNGIHLPVDGGLSSSLPVVPGQNM